MYSESNLFRKAYKYAMRSYDQVAILSAKYGLLLPDEEIEPYELTLKNRGKDKRLEWSKKALHQMEQKIGLDRIRGVFFHAGKEYRQFLRPMLKQSRISCEVPLEGLSIGRQLAWYNKRETEGLRDAC